MLKQKGPLALIILDGFGHSDAREGNAVALAQMPFYDELREKYPHTLIEASGTCVGLPGGIMGNSEVGHLNMGAGRVIMTDIRRIDYSVETGEFFQNVAFVTALDNAKARGGAVHLMGLLSDGLVHSSQEHLYALLRLAKERGLARAYVHCFLDGRDTPPSSAHLYVKALQDRIAETGFGEIATVCGRYYAMDRDNRWERTKRAYDMLVSGVGERADDPPAAVRRSYERGVTDEFVEPAVITGADGSPTATIRDGDAVIFFNFRADRARQLTRALAVDDFDGFPVPDRPRTDYVCFTLYDQTFGLPIAFPQLRHKNILAEVFAAVGVRNYRLAETEKYAHVTYFFNGGTEREYPSERRLLVPSPKVATYDLMPEMAAFKVTDKVL
ncbi:MAG TPA: 2,3-bisphosphoglycerate-independent phosphoglycerate mutase, partial [Pyrinomonadaceae bacterium]